MGSGFLVGTVCVLPRIRRGRNRARRTGLTPAGAPIDSTERHGKLRLVVLTVYLAALIFGLGIFAVQMLFSSSDAGHSGPELGHGGEGALAELGDAGEHALSGAASHGDWASVFTSLRFYMFAAIAFGVVGAPVTWLRLGSSGLTLAAAAATALVVGAGAALGFRLLGRQTLSSGVAAPELVGHVGRVLLACEKGRRGKVRLNVRGQLIDFIATTEDARLAPGTAVIVQEVSAERLVVCAAPIELLPE